MGNKAASISDSDQKMAAVIHCERRYAMIHLLWFGIDDAE